MQRARHLKETHIGNSFLFLLRARNAREQCKQSQCGLLLRFPLQKTAYTLHTLYICMPAFRRVQAKRVRAYVPLYGACGITEARATNRFMCAQTRLHTHTRTHVASTRPRNGPRDNARTCMRSASVALSEWMHASRRALNVTVCVCLFLEAHTHRIARNMDADVGNMLAGAAMRTACATVRRRVCVCVCACRVGPLIRKSS